jgi:hypothetical protein
VLVGRDVVAKIVDVKVWQQNWPLVGSNVAAEITIGLKDTKVYW